jgi:hypothetical protein
MNYAMMHGSVNIRQKDVCAIGSIKKKVNRKCRIYHILQRNVKDNVTNFGLIKLTILLSVIYA